MSSPDQILAVLTFLVASYPAQEIGAATVHAYAAALGDLDPEQLSVAAVDWIRRSRWWPTVAELRGTVAELYGPELPSGIEIWTELERAAFGGAQLNDLSRDAQEAFYAYGVPSLMVRLREATVPSLQAERARFLDWHRVRQGRREREERRAALAGVQLPALLQEGED